MKKKFLATLVALLVPAFAWAAPETFGAYVTALASSGSLEQVVVYSVASSCGVIVHYAKQWADGRVDGSLWKYLVTCFPSRTVLMVLAQIGCAAAYGLTGAWVGMGWGALLASAFTAGYAIDSAINRGGRAQPDRPAGIEPSEPWEHA